jgi:hypothetical protein
MKAFAGRILLEDLRLVRLSLGGAALQRCDDGIVLSAALDAEVARPEKE